MAVTRPLKEGSVTTYQAKVAAGFPDILASEMDADLDTIYAAWNGGVSTANLGNGSVTYAKLAPDAQLWRDTGTALTPGTNFATRDLTGNGNLFLPSATITKLGLKLTFDSFSTYADLCNNTSDALNYELGRPGYILRLDCGADLFQLIRRPAASTSYGVTFSIDSNGNLQIVGPIATKASGTTWSNPSDPRLKDAVAPYARGLADVLALEPITYRLKATPDGPMCYGFDAAKVREVFPECVSETRMKLDPDDAEETAGVLSFDMHPILVALVNAVKELAAR